MQKQFYFLSPVEVVKVTTQNLQEVAEWCGGRVASTESRRVAGRMDQYVWVPTPKGTAISWAFPGMFVTKRLVRTVKNDLRVTYAVFRKDYFDKNYFDTPAQAVEETWEKDFAAEIKATHKPAKVDKKSMVGVNETRKELGLPPLEKTESGEFTIAGAEELMETREQIVINQYFGGGSDPAAVKAEMQEIIGSIPRKSK